MKILVADDDMISHRLVESVLGAEVNTKANGTDKCLNGNRRKRSSVLEQTCSFDTSFPHHATP